MRRTVAVLLALTLAAAFPAAAPPAALAAYCGADVTGLECCPSTPAAADCQSADCAGSGAALPVALPDRGYAAAISDSPRTSVTRLIAPLARAPDTAPPKPVV